MFFSGTVIHAKLHKVCLHFGAKVYDFPDALPARRAAEVRAPFPNPRAPPCRARAMRAGAPHSVRVPAQLQLRQRLADLDEVLRRTGQQRREVLDGVAQQWSNWRHVCDTEKATLHALNLLSFDIKRKIFRAEGWVPASEVGHVREALMQAATRSGSATKPIVDVLETSETPPTHLPTNKFTSGFQVRSERAPNSPRVRALEPPHAA